MLKRLFQLTVKPVTSKSHRQLMDADYPGLRYAREKISHSAVTYGETPCLTSPGTSECRMNGQGHKNEKIKQLIQNNSISQLNKIFIVDTFIISMRKMSDVHLVFNISPKH